MNGAAFDRLSKRLGASTTRRGLLKAFVAGVAAAIVGSVRSSFTAEAGSMGSPYPSTFLKGVGYEAFPTPYSGEQRYPLLHGQLRHGGQSA